MRLGNLQDNSGERGLCGSRTGCGALSTATRRRAGARSGRIPVALQPLADVRMNSRDMAALLPDISVLRDRSRALAMIEAIVSPEWESRYYSFDVRWAEDQQMASMRNGSGDEYSIVFTQHGAFIRGFDHESPMSPALTQQLWPGLIDDVPVAFLPQVSEPAFSCDGRLEATFCLWRLTTHEAWQTGAIDYPQFGGYRTSPDGSEVLAILCDASPRSYLAFASDYYEVTVDPDAAELIWALSPLDSETVAALNPAVTLVDIRSDLNQIGYPA